MCLQLCFYVFGTGHNWHRLLVQRYVNELNVSLVELNFVHYALYVWRDRLSVHVQ